MIAESSHFKHTLKRFVNNSITLYWYKISSSSDMKCVCVCVCVWVGLFVGGMMGCGEVGELKLTVQEKCSLEKAQRYYD